MYDGLYQNEKLVAKMSQEAKVWRMYQMGVDIKEIASNLGITTVTVYNILKRVGCETNRKRK